MNEHKIHFLDPLEAQHIAAGEVVERPANIVKELIENSLDAGADAIIIKIEKAGKKSITISDNGCGMSRGDAERCFARHATSKLTSVHELMSLATFGFRGEALASIAAVGEVTLTTRRAQDLLGTTVTYTHGRHTGTTESGGPTGTTLSDKNLFATVPVRRTFFKQDETEWNQIQSVVQGLALTHQTVSFMLYKDEALVLEAPQASSLKDRITQLFGHTVAAQMINVSHQGSGLCISGMISRPPYARYGKELLFFWINNRLIKNNDIARAIVKGYLQALPLGKYPAAFLSLSLDAAQVDVNIHPRKEEVRFTKPGVVASTIQEAITAALNNAINTTLGSPPAQKQPIPAFTFSPQLASMPPLTHSASAQQAVAIFSAPVPEHRTTHPTPTAATTPTIAPLPEPFLEKPIIIGQLFATYILIQQEEAFILIDQHAAHERVLYHHYTTRFTQKEGTSLLFPEVVHCASAELVAHLINAQDFFNDQGITFIQSGPRHLTITSAPPQLQKEGLSAVILDAADFIASHATLDRQLFRQKLNEHVHSHLACKLAVKAGDVLDTAAMSNLVEQLLKTPDRFMCIHGRPTMWPISRVELEKRFRRRN